MTDFSKMTNDELQAYEGDHRHGGAFDRGSADSYYHRPRAPHYFEGGTYQTPEIKAEEGSDEWNEYMAGYEYNERSCNKKDWG